jgi:hypothetical protein
LVSNKVYLQIGDAGLITAETQRSAEVRREERQKPKFHIGKVKINKKDNIKAI